MERHMSDDLSPLVARRRLRVELRNARQESRRTQDQVAAAMEWSLSKIIRIESGAVGMSTNDLRALLRHYGIKDQSKTAELLALGRLSRERPWWSAHKDLISPQLGQLIDYEAAAAVICSFQPLVIPGLLQTEEYARVMIGQFGNASSRERLDNIVKIRMKRQELLERPDHPKAFFVLDEAVIRRWVGGKDVMRRQLEHLVAMSGKRDVTVEIVPFSIGLHPGLQGPFVILDFPDPSDDELLYLENSRGELVIRADPQEISGYHDKFEQLQKLTPGVTASITFLDQIIKEMK